jgi:hypothetical protein
MRDIFFAIVGFLLTILSLFGLKYLDKQIDFFSNFWPVFSPIKFIAFILGLGGFILLGSSQGEDFFLGYSDDLTEGYWLRFAGFALWISVWSGITWYSCRVVLNLAEIKLKSEPRKTERFIKFLPRFLGFIPFFIVIYPFYQNDDWPFLIIIIALMLIYLWLVIYREDLVKRFFKNDENFLQNFKKRTQLAAQDYRDLPYTTQLVLKMTFVITAFFFLLFFVSQPFVSQWFTAPVIVLIALSTWTVVGMMISWLENRTDFPIFLMLIVLILVFSNWNDNHQIRLGNNEVKLVNDAEYFRKWIEARKKEINNCPKDTPYPVFLIASAGGGSRAAYWTNAVLSELEKKYPKINFYEHILAMSGVSGGSVGIGFYGAAKQSKSKIDPTKAVGEDFLAPLLSGFFYTNFIQIMLPYPIQSLDRAHRLEDGFAFELEILNQTVNEVFPTDNSTKHPMYFFNCTHLETGRKAIISNINLNPDYYADIVDVNKIVQKQILLKTAISSSARFPYVTPPATLVDSNHKKWGHLIDGGYLENSGLATIAQTLKMMKSVIDKCEDSTFCKIQPIIIFLENSDYTIDENDLPVTKFLYESTAPLKGFFYAWGRGTVPLAKDMATRKFDLPKEPIYQQFNLKYPLKPNGKPKKIPLGWQLSDSIKTYMRSKAKEVVALSGKISFCNQDK